MLMGSHVFKGDGLLEPRVVNRDHGVMFGDLEYHSDHEKEHAQNAEQARCDTQATPCRGMATRRCRLRHDHPVDVDKMQNQKVDGPSKDQFWVSADMATHQASERQHPVEENQDQGDLPPRAFLTLVEPMRFFRNIAVPDQQKLAEGNVGPKEHKAEHVFSKVVVVFNGDLILNCASFLQQVDRDGDDAVC